MSYSNGLLSDQSYKSANKFVQGLPGVGFKLTDTGDYDMQNKKLVNVKNGVNGSDAVTKSQLDTKTSLLDGARTHGYIVNNKAVIYSQSGAVHAKSFYLQDQNEDEVRILTDNQDFDNVHLFVPNLKNFDGFGGRIRSEIMVTSVDQIISGNKFFQNIKASNPSEDDNVANKNYVDFEITKQNVLIDNEFVKKSGSLMTGDLILPHYNYPVQGNTNKAISYETQREIFLSRKETFPMETSLDMNNNVIENVTTPTSSHQATNKGYCDYNFLSKQKGGVLMGPLSMNRNDLIEIPDTPKFGHSAVNKKYVDGEITKIDTTPFVKLDGSRAMTGNLDMGDHFIQKVSEPVNLDDVATKNYVDAEIGYISTPFLKLDGTRAMTGVLNMNDHKISNLKMPEFNTDAANKQYIDEALLKSHLVSSHIENAFKYLSDQDESSSERNIIVHGIQDFNGSPHKNKKAYDIDLIYTSGTQNYDSKIGINLYPLPVGKFTIIMEYYFPEDINISLLAEASTAIINNQTITNFPSYKKQLVQINQQTKDTPDYLFFTIRGSGTTATNPEGYLVFYGVKEWVDLVPPEIYDYALETGLFEYDNGNMKMNMDLDLTSHNIINSYQITGLIDFINYFLLFKNFIKNKTYIDIFTYRFYDLKEPSNFILDGPAISGINPNMSIKSSGSSHITVSGFDPIRGLQFNPSTKIIIDLGYMVNQNSPYTIMISLTLKDHLRLYFVEPIHEQTAYLPAYIYNPFDHTIRIEDNKALHAQNYPVVLYNKQSMIWIYYNPSETKYEIIIGNGNYKNIITPPISNFFTNKLRIDANNNIINKICYQNQHFASAETFTKMMFEERKNGSYF